jgi:hypothetical protein
MKTIRVCKFDATGVHHAEEVTLVIDETLPEAVSQQFFDEQADCIMQALSSLPGGTKAALLVRMLQEKADVLRVRERDANPPEDLLAQDPTIKVYDGTANIKGAEWMVKAMSFNASGQRSYEAVARKANIVMRLTPDLALQAFATAEKFCALVGTDKK